MRKASEYLGTLGATGDSRTKIVRYTGNRNFFQKIGEMVMQELEKRRRSSYVRFASVYRQFKDINTFLEELNSLLQNKK